MSDEENLSDLVNRAKARWLKRVMCCSAVASTEKVLAYAIADRLNCVTLDCWPAQRTLAKVLGCKSDKTVQRVARGLRAKQFITITRSKGTAVYRYAPVLRPDDWNNSGQGSGQNGPDQPGTNVRQSYLEIHLRSDPTVAEKGNGATSPFKRGTRGSLEIRVADKFGPNGMEILGRLGAIDDAIVDRLCAAFVDGRLSARELAAARLAAQQAR